MLIADPQYAEKRKRAVDYIGQIEKIASKSDRWRAIQKFMFSLNPELVTEDQIHCAEVAERRNDQINKFGSTKNSGMRQLYSMPEYLYRALQTMDPDFQRIQSSGNDVEIRKLNHSIWKVFPEYRVGRIL